MFCFVWGNHFIFFFFFVIVVVVVVVYCKICILEKNRICSMFYSIASQ